MKVKGSDGNNGGGNCGSVVGIELPPPAGIMVEVDIHL